MAFTHTFEIDIEGEGYLQGELDFDNPNDGLKFTSISDNMELHVKSLQCITSMMIRMKEMNKGCDLNRFEVVKK